MFFRGRENAHKDRGRDMLSRIKTSLEDVAKVESDVRQEGSRMHLTLLPKPGLKQQPQAKKPAPVPAPKNDGQTPAQPGNQGEAHAEAENRQGGPEAV